MVHTALSEIGTVHDRRWRGGIWPLLTWQAWYHNMNFLDDSHSIACESCTILYAYCRN